MSPDENPVESTELVVYNPKEWEKWALEEADLVIIFYDRLVAGNLRHELIRDIVLEFSKSLFDMRVDCRCQGGM